MPALAGGPALSPALPASPAARALDGFTSYLWKECPLSLYESELGSPGTKAVPSHHVTRSLWAPSGHLGYLGLLHEMGGAGRGGRC